VHLGREKVRNELAKIGWPVWVLGAAEAVKGWAVSHGLMTAGGAAATGGGAAATGGGAAAGGAAAGGAVLTGPGWLAIGAAVVVTAVTVIAVAELYKWATAKPPAEPPAVTKPAASSSNDALEPDKWSDAYKKKGLIQDIDEFVTPQTPATSGGSRGTGSSQAPADNVQAPTGTSDVSRNGTQLASNPSSSDSSGSSPSGDSGGDTPDPGLVPKSLDPDSSGSDGGGGGGGGTGGATDAAAPNPPPPDGMGTGPHTASLPHNQGGTGSSGEPVNTPAQPPASSLWTPNQQPVPTG
jgi:hypothetical protein